MVLRVFLFGLYGVLLAWLLATWPTTRTVRVTPWATLFGTSLASTQRPTMPASGWG